MVLSAAAALLTHTHTHTHTHTVRTTLIFIQAAGEQYFMQIIRIFQAQNSQHFNASRGERRTSAEAFGH